MKDIVRQGDILKVEGINPLVLVTSKNYFNETGEIIGCPIFENGSPGALHLFIETEERKGLVHCEKLKLLDLNARRYSKIDEISMPIVMDITDAIQGIFDYI